mmetsp:Transcript_37925/g.92997  ORF Transcript_37925/g.92997 Transcript_37925/m.92997 type:complete len:216 (-) Transcript_37925:303-950(-)
MALPTLRAPSVLVATVASTSLMCSLASELLAPSTRSRRSTFTCRNGSVTPFTSYSGAYADVVSARSVRTSCGTSARNCLTSFLRAAPGAAVRTSSSASVVPVSSTPWLRSPSMGLTSSTNVSRSSGTLRTTRTAHSAAFLRMYGFDDCTSLDTSGAQSWHISGDAMLPSEHSARPTMKWFGCSRSDLSELVTSMSTSCRSSSSSMRPRYPMRLSE